MVISIFIGVSNYSEGNIFLPKKCGFATFFSKNCGLATRSKFYPKTAISAVNLKLPVTACLYLS